MKVELPGDDDPRRRALRDWLAEHRSPSGRDLAEAGLVAPHWPKPWGLGADATHQLIVDDELRRAGVSRPQNQIGIGWAGPTLIAAGSEEQKRRYLLPLLAGEEIWCQLFSEPDAGSDLASLRTTAARDGDEWVVNGSKVWTSMGHIAAFGILLARTNPEVSAQQGITYFVCPMDLPGITVRPIKEMTGAALFNQVTFDDVRLPASCVVGEVDQGWRLAKVTLANERVSLSSGGVLWGHGPKATDLIELVRRRPSGVVVDALQRQRLVEVYIEGELLALLGARLLGAALAGKQPGPEVSVRKALADEHGQHVMGLAVDLAGAAGMLNAAGPYGSTDPTWSYGFLFSPALTIGGGTSEVQRDIIGERVLGLPGSARA